MQWHEVAVLALACWRIASLVQFERGPGGCFQRWREKLGIGHNEDGEPISWPDSEMGRLYRCLWCGSLWVGLGLAGLYLLSARFTVVLALPFALSAVAIGLEVMLDGKGEH